MKTKRYTIALFSLLALVSITLFGCSGQTADTGGATPKEAVNTPVQENTRLAEVKKRGKIIVGTFAKIPPLTFLDASGEHIGHDIEIMNEIASDMGVEIEFKDIFFPEMFPALDNGEVDIIISGITITEERAENYAFSSPYFDSGQVIAAKDDSGITGPEDLKGKKIAVVAGTTGEEEAKKYTDASMVIGYEDESRRTALENGEVDAVIEDYAGVGPYVKNTPGISIIGDPITQEYYGIGAKKDSTALIKEVNAILREMKRDGRISDIKNKWY